MFCAFFPWHAVRFDYYYNSLLNDTPPIPIPVTPHEQESQHDTTPACILLLLACCLPAAGSRLPLSTPTACPLLATTACGGFFPSFTEPRRLVSGQEPSKKKKKTRRTGCHIYIRTNLTVCVRVRRARRISLQKNAAVVDRQNNGITINNLFLSSTTAFFLKIKTKTQAKNATNRSTPKNPRVLRTYYYFLRTTVATAVLVIYRFPLSPPNAIAKAPCTRTCRVHHSVRFDA